MKTSKVGIATVRTVLFANDDNKVASAGLGHRVRPSVAGVATPVPTTIALPPSQASPLCRRRPPGARSESERGGFAFIPKRFLRDGFFVSVTRDELGCICC